MTELTKAQFNATGPSPPPSPKPETEAEANRRLYAENQKLKELLAGGGVWNLNGRYLKVTVRPYEVLAVQWGRPDEKLKKD